MWPTFTFKLKHDEIIYLKIINAFGKNEFLSSVFGYTDKPLNFYFGKILYPNHDQMK